MQADSRGLALTTSNEVAAKHVDQAVSDYLDYRVTASGHVKAALDADPGFALAQCFRGYFLLMLENRAVLPKVQQTLDGIRPNLGAITRRERLHASALEAWAAGDIMKACFHWEEILADYPLDLLALKLHHTMAFYTGRSQVMRSVVASVLGFLAAADPLGRDRDRQPLLDRCSARLDGRDHRGGRRTPAVRARPAGGLVVPDLSLQGGGGLTAPAAIN
jgi:hypothetical protein